MAGGGQGVPALAAPLPARLRLPGSELQDLVAGWAAAAAAEGGGGRVGTGGLTLAVDVSAHLAAKRDAMRCHGSQIEDTSFFLQMPDEAFAMSFGTEWFIEHDAQPPFRTGWIFPAP